MMKLKPLLITVLVAIAFFITSFTVVSPSARAASNQGMNQPALLSAPDPDFKINVYTKPGMKEPTVGYGLAGDRVTILEQVGSNEGYTWNYVRFDNPPNVEGWVRTDYLSFQLPASQLKGGQTQRQMYQNSSQSQGYLGGNRQPSDQGNSQNSQSTYSQQSNSPNSLTSLPQKVLNLFKKS